jgi:hypothetical protein
MIEHVFWIAYKIAKVNRPIVSITYAAVTKATVGKTEQNVQKKKNS